jgi:hypothetical protein
MSFNSNKSMATGALYSGIIIMIIGMIIAPIGIIDRSVLYGTGQLFILCATLAGCGETISKIMDLMNQNQNKRTTRKKEVTHES